MQQTDTIKKYCTLCHGEDLMTVGSAPSAAGERVGMLRCADCHSYVPDYFAEWEQASLLASQLKLHEGLWKEESDEEYLAGREELSALVGILLEGVEMKPGQRLRVFASLVPQRQPDLLSALARPGTDKHSLGQQPRRSIESTRPRTRPVHGTEYFHGW